MLEAPVCDLPQAEKSALLLRRLNALNQWHQQHSPEFARILVGYDWPVAATDETMLPFLAVRLFKHLLLASVPEAERFKTLTSGTTGCGPRIVLDKTNRRAAEQGAGAHPAGVCRQGSVADAAGGATGADPEPGRFFGAAPVRSGSHFWAAITTMRSMNRCSPTGR